LQVNGYFELSSNRRDIWFGEGLSGDGLLRAQWNKALLEYVVAPCYARALICMTDTKIMPPHMHATLFPRDVPPEPWDILFQSTLNIVRTQPCLFTTANGGAWVAPMDALIVRRTSEDYEDFVRWLLQDGIPIVTTLSETVENVLIKSKVVSGFLLPKVLRSQYAGRDSLHAGNLNAIKSVLGFMARDLDGMTLGELSGIRLLPLCDGSLSTFWKPSEGGHAARLDHLCSMGFTRAQSLRALQMTGNESVEIALNWLISNPPMPTASGDDDSPAHSTYFIPSDEERVIFSRAKNRLVDTKALPSTVKKLLSSNARAPLNVRAIDTDGFEDLLSVVFPREWYGKTCVPWKTDEETYSNFSEEWIRRFWQYVGPSTRLRSLQSKWPILPTESGFLYSLSSTSGVVSPELLPASCIAALTKIGVPLLLKNLFAAFQPHIEIWNYVHQPTPGGLLSSVANLCNAPELEVKKSFRSVTGHEREQLMQFLLADGCKDLDSTQRLALSKIPIFRGIIPLGQVVEYDVTWTEASDDEKQLSGNSPVYVGLDGAGSSGPRSVCQGIKWHFLDKHFVSVKDDDSSMMDSLSRLSVRSITKAKFLADFLVPRLSGMSVDFRIDFTCHLLRDLSSWLADDSSGDLLRLIETEPLFPAMNGEPKRIGDLFDPEIEAFSKIMDESFYPAIELQEPQPLSVLRSLGLQRYLSRRSILALACSIDAEQAKIMSRDCEDEQLSELTSALRLRAIEFFKYLDVQMDQLVAVSKPERTTKKKNVKEKGLRFWRSIVGETGSASNERRIGMQSEEMEEQLAIERREIDDFIAKLEVIAWAPVAHHLGFSLPRHSDDPRLVVSPPEHVRLPKYQFLCSSQFHILGHDLRSDTLRERFKWSQLIPVEVIAKQLKAIVTSHKSKAHFGGEWSALYEIYRRLSRFFEAEPDTELRERVLAVLSGDFDFIWVGDKFVAPHQVALSTRVNAEPYLFGVSSEMAHFRPFLKAVGVRERFSTTDYVEALARMHENTQLQSTDEGQKRSLSTDEQIAAIGLVQLICDSLSHHTDYELFVPDARGMLMRSVELSFDDAPWLDKREIDLEAVQLIHPKISNEVATKIGARSLRSLLLHANQTESLLFSTAGDMEAFGQTEAITKRISHILEQYPDGPHIISELIQNADDAGANRVCIMYSDVTFGSSSLLSPAMSKWQGPALYCVRAMD
jgi:sacsin